jgi:anaerobic selenocysteine-containing dehydrogenase
MLKPYGGMTLSLNRPAIPPVGESLPNSEIFRRLAAAMNYDEPCFSQGDEEALREFVTVQTHPRFAGITWKRLMAEGFVRINLPMPYLPFAEGNFPTPTGKCEFYSQRMADDGYDPLPEYTPPLWQEAVAGSREWAVGSGEGKARRRRERSRREAEMLVCISPPAHSFLNSTFANVDRFLRREEMPLLQIHPQDAAARGVEEGATVRVWNDLGSIELTARVTKGLIEGTVLAPGVWWAKFSPDGRNVNQLVSQDETDMGASALFYDTQVWVEPVRAERVEDVQLGEPVAAD